MFITETGEDSLLEAPADLATIFCDHAPIFLKSGDKPGEDLQFFELGIIQLQIALRRTVNGAVPAPDSRNGFPRVNCGQYAQFKQRRRKVDLVIRDGHQVDRNYAELF